MGSIPSPRLLGGGPAPRRLVWAADAGPGKREPPPSDPRASLSPYVWPWPAGESRSAGIQTLQWVLVEFRPVLQSVAGLLVSPRVDPMGNPARTHPSPHAEGGSPASETRRLLSLRAGLQAPRAFPLLRTIGALRVFEFQANCLLSELLRFLHL